MGATGATWLDRQLLGETSQIAGQTFGAEARQAMQQRMKFLWEEGLAERQGNQIRWGANSRIIA